MVFAGNNEDYQIAEEQKVVDYNDNSGDYLHSKFPAYVFVRWYWTDQSILTVTADISTKSFYLRSLSVCLPSHTVEALPTAESLLVI
jgi:hypothetical protein